MSLKISVNQNDVVTVEDTGGGEGNPNYVHTVTGVVSSPWGSVNPAALHQSVIAGDASASLDIDATALGYGHIYIQMSQFRSNAIAFSGISTAGLSVDNWLAIALSYGLDGVLDIALLLQGGTVTAMNQYAPSLSTVLTINHHPLP